MTTRAKAWLILSLALAAVSTSCLRGSTEAPERPPNIVLISIDGLRADYLTAEHMPLLDGFARKRCRVYTNAYSNSTWSKPSHVTMLSGLLQSQHGVEYANSFIPPELPMIQQKMKRAGYTTAAFVDGEDVGRKWGFGRGFDKFYQSFEAYENPDMEDTAFKERIGGRAASLDEAEKFLVSHPEQPVFMFVQIGAVGGYGQAAPGNHEKAQSEAGGSPAERRRLYADAVLEFDKRLDRFMNLLRYSSIFHGATVMITSAHGEGLGDVHDGVSSHGHAKAPYSDQIDVPLIVYGLENGTTNRLVGVDDIAGTILRLARVEPDPAKSLFRARDTVIAEYVPREGEQAGRSVAIISEGRKFLVSLDGDLRLFEDPRDSTDLIRRRHAGITKQDISAGLRQQLNALGYLQ